MKRVGDELPLFGVEPPRVDVLPELDWVVSRALTPVNLRRQLNGLNPDVVVALARRLDLVARIASECGQDELAGTLGTGWSRAFREEFEAVSVRVACLRRIVDLVDGIAGELGTRVLLLKGMANEVLGVTRRGSRPMVDVDFLVPRTDAWKVHKTLRMSRFERQIGAGTEWQLPLLVDHDGFCVEIHDCLMLIDPGASTWIGAEDLLERDQLVSLPALNHSRSLNHAIHTAHLLHHSLFQHFLSPTKFPIFGRLLCDLSDLGWGNRGCENFFRDGYGFVEHHVAWECVQAVGALLAEIERGSLASEVEANGGLAGLALRFWFSSAFSLDYQTVMRRQSIYSSRLGSVFPVAHGHSNRPSAECDGARHSSFAQSLRSYVSLPLRGLRFLRRVVRRLRAARTLRRMSLREERLEIKV